MCFVIVGCRCDVQSSYSLEEVVVQESGQTEFEAW